MKLSETLKDNEETRRILDSNKREIELMRDKQQQ